MSVSITSDSPESTKNVGLALSKLLKPGDVLSLSGDLGAGKTCLVKGIGAGLGIEEPLTSPSFLLRKDYEGTDLTLAHIDLYRLNTIHDLDVLGLTDTPEVVAAIEWGHMSGDALGEDRLEIDISFVDEENFEDDSRLITLTPHGKSWESRLDSNDWQTGIDE